jgi:hypothetical protein
VKSIYYELLVFAAETVEKWMSPNNPKYLIGKTISINKPGYPERYFACISDRVFPRQTTVNQLLKHTDSKIVTDHALILDIVEYEGKLGKEFYYKTLTPFGLKQLIWFDIYDMDIWKNFHIRDFVDVID